MANNQQHLNMVDVYQLALTKVSGIGTRTAQEIVKNLGSARALFEEKEANLRIIFRNKEKTIRDIVSRKMFGICEKEIDFMQKYGIESYFFTDGNYPSRLKEIPDKPVCLFVQGQGNVEAKRTAAIVGSRRCSDYGRIMTETIVNELQKYGVSVISGLAYGIDSAAHRACIARNIPTFGVLAHGLDRVYPAAHFELARQMCEMQGGLVTEYFTGTTPFPSFFPARNRIIAGLSDVVIVVEASKTGGALLTARLANDYNREVMALPGRLGDANSQGCNFLIESNRAHILSDVSSIAKLMSWNETESEKTAKPVVEDKGSGLKGAEKQVYYAIKQAGETDVDTLLAKTSMPYNELSAALLNLELSDCVIAKPGKVYKAL